MEPLLTIKIFPLEKTEPLLSSNMIQDLLYSLLFEVWNDSGSGKGHHEREGGAAQILEEMALLVTHETPLLSLLWNCVVASGLFSITVVASAIVMDCGFCVLMMSYHLTLIPVNWSEGRIQKMRRRKVSRSSLPHYAWFCSKGHLSTQVLKTEMVSILFLIIYSAFFCILTPVFKVIIF